MAGTFKIDIDTGVLRNTATKIGNINENLDGKLQEIKKTMNSLEDDWISEASTEIRGEMNSLESHFKTYFEIAKSYKDFLERTAESYESTESTLKNNASNVNMFK